MHRFVYPSWHSARRWFTDSLTKLSQLWTTKQYIQISSFAQKGRYPIILVFISTVASSFLMFVAPVFSLSEGARGTEVKELQQALSNLRYFDGSITGFYGSQTVAAVISFQRDFNLVPDGVAGPATIRELERRNAFIRGNTQNLQTHTLQQLFDTQNVPEQIVDDILSRISTDLTALQTELQNLGFYQGPIDGAYGPLTETAIISYAFETLLPNRTDLVLEFGDEGALVRRLQERLQKLGYYSGIVDGNFGPRTEAAVINFQRDASLVVDGRVGPNTLTALDQIPDYQERRI